VRCGIGSWGSQCPSATDYVAMTKAHGRGDHRQMPLMSASLAEVVRELRAPDEPEQSGVMDLYIP